MTKLQTGQLVRYRYTGHIKTIGLVTDFYDESMPRELRPPGSPPLGSNLAIYQIWWSVAPSDDMDWANSYWWGEDSLELIGGG